MGRNWVITIGINRYRNLQRLHYAKRDAEAMQTFFHQDLHVDHLYHFSDDSPPIPQDYGDALESHPTFATLRRFLRVRFESPFLGDGDTLWFFFAGHGIRYEDRDYLMPLDGDPGDVSSTAIPLHYVTERLRRCGADTVILLIDACRSPSGRRDGVGVGEEKQQGVITLFSCSPRESSYEIDELQQGAFTHALLESLRLQGEENCATVERLYQRLRSSVPALNQRYQKPQQTPYGSIEPPTKYHLILLPQQATSSDILTLKNDAYRAESGQALAQAKQLWTRTLAIAATDAEAIEGIERLARISAAPLTPPQPKVSPPASEARLTAETSSYTTTQPTMSSSTIEVFISYSHKDESLKDDLYMHLANLTRQGKIKPWQDREIEAGTEWDAEIKARLESASVILLLITPRFIASEYCFDKEMQRAMERHAAGTARVIPIIMKPCDWQDTAFSKLQVLPRDAKPVTSWSDPDEALLDVVKGIRRAVDSLASSTRQVDATPSSITTQSVIAPDSISLSDGRREAETPVLLQLTVEQRKALRAALIAAFPSQPQLELMVEDELEESLNRITQGQSNYELAVRDLVKWAESGGKVQSLLEGAVQANPGNPKLQELAKLWLKV